MKIECIKMSFLEENCYVLTLNGKIILIDPGSDFDKIDSYISNNLLAVLVTHNHSDHTLSLTKLVDKYNCLLYSADNIEEKEYDISGFKFKALYTKGHSKDSITYYFYNDKVMFTGDFIFLEDIGRCDLFGGNFKEMLESIAKIKTFPTDVTMYPGHGNKTTLQHELEHNQYFL